jgi:hypothetical protein
MLTDIITNLDKIINEIETKVTPSNIKEGIEIFGVEGSLETLTTQTKTVSPSLYTQVIVPDVEYNGLHEIIVNAVTSAIDQNIKSSNIRYGQRILNVAGLLSKLTEEEYNDAILLELQILGHTIYVSKLRLTLDENFSVDENDVLHTNNCTVEGTKLIINN